MLQRLKRVMRGPVFATSVATFPAPVSAAELGPWNAEVPCDAGGRALTGHFSWSARAPSALRALRRLEPVRLELVAARDGERARVRGRDPSRQLALAANLTPAGAGGARIPSAYYSDDHLGLVPGEKHEGRSRQGAPERLESAAVALRGWNARHDTAPIAAPR